MEMIVLKNGKHSAKISLTGAEHFSHRINGVEQLYPGLILGKTGNMTYDRTSPDMFPTPGRTGLPPVAKGSEQSEFVFDGKKFRTQIHGFVRDMKFEIFATNGTSYVELFTKSNEETKKQYPFDFEYHVQFFLSSKGDVLKQVSVFNTGETKMAFARGDHPCYLVDGELGEYSIRFENVSTYFYKEGKCDKKIPRSYYEFQMPKIFGDPETVIFSGVKDATLVLKRNGIPVKSVFVQGPDVWIWTNSKPGDVPFIAMECVQGTSVTPIYLPSKMNNKTIDQIEEIEGAIILPSGGSFYSQYIMFGSPERKPQQVFDEFFQEGFSDSTKLDFEQEER